MYRAFRGARLLYSGLPALWRRSGTVAASRWEATTVSFYLTHMQFTSILSPHTGDDPTLSARRADFRHTGVQRYAHYLFD
jgi:hypothetical protein